MNDYRTRTRVNNADIVREQIAAGQLPEDPAVITRIINNLLRKAKEQSRQAEKLKTEGNSIAAEAMRAAAAETQHQAEELRGKLPGREIKQNE